MSNDTTFVVDGVEVAAAPGQTILEAAEAHGVYVPRLCHAPDLVPFGGCRICTVKANGRMVAACTHPVSPGMVVENDTQELTEHRRVLIEMLFVEGNHFCMTCEKSGNCELQALAYRFGVSAPRFLLQFPQRDVDASHPDILIDRNRCVLCGRCVRASRDVDGKHVFDFVGRGPKKRLAIAAGACLADSDAAVTDAAVDICPVGALLKKRVGFATPVGQRRFDAEPIGSDIEAQPEEVS